ncbi:hypothetical protein LOAG_03877 [Loa loa]|uniref:Uncharacterized protein n=1 Tax=Loa loa TaxID=7209 RepID=A0A1S0U3E5_LOALO|nr:hypothetical protein LOAG_03877 [Loa loa]EFO24610.1 hypothetical protein LOAG_03877 [Loa loa]
MSTSKHESMSSLSANPTDSHFVDERSESLTSLNIKADLPLSDSSDETENSAMKILDNLIEQLPKSPSVITKKNRMSVVSDLNYDQPHINVVKFDANVHQQAEIEAEYDRKLIRNLSSLFIQ